MDDKRLSEQSKFMRFVRPFIKELVSKRLISNNLFQNAAQPLVIKQLLKKAYPSGDNVDKNLIELLHLPSQRPGASEAFRGFINLFNDYLAPDLMRTIDVPVDLIWGRNDPWEPIQEAERWFSQIECIRSLKIIDGAGHCPHDEKPEEVNEILLYIIQQAT